MRTIFGLASIAFVAFLAWNIGGRLSTDAVGMAVGLLFGILPLALLALANGRQSPPACGNDEGSARARATAMPGQAPKVQYTQARPFALPAPKPALVGEVVNPNGCPYGVEPWIWEELYDRGRTAPTHRVRLVDVHRTTIDGSGVRVDEAHMLPPEVAARLYGERRFKVVGEMEQTT
jgi:hypothetical protein